MGAWWVRSLGAISIVLFPFLTIAQPTKLPAAKRSGPAWVRVTGDLDSTWIVRRVAAAIEEARQSNATAIVLEIDSNRARLDVVSPLAQLAHECDIPVSAYLRDGSDHRIGVGALLLALSCRSAAMDPDTAVRSEDGDSLADLIGEAADLEQATRRLNGFAAAALALRNSPQGLADLLTNLGERTLPTWVVFSSSGAPALVTDEPRNTSSVARIVVHRTGNPPQIVIDAATTERLGLITTRAASESAALRAFGINGSVRNRTVIEGGIEKQRDAIARSLEEIDTAIERAKSTLDLPDPPHTSTASERYRRAAATADTHLASARTSIAACEATLEEFPELLFVAAPGQTSAGASRSNYATKWRSTLQTRRDKVAKLSSRSELFRSQ